MDITLKQAQNLHDSEQMKQLLTTLVEYHQRIVEKALSALNDEETAIATWQRFMQRLDEFPYMMPLPQGTFDDHPEILKNVLKDHFFPFYAWIKSNLSDRHTREQAILRNIFHFAEQVKVSTMDGVISSK